MASHSQTLRLRRPTNVHISSISSASDFLRWDFSNRQRGSRNETSAAFFINLTTVIRATPVARTVLRYELHSPSKASTWEYCTALAIAASTKRAWYPHTLQLLAALRAIAADVFAAAAGAQVLRINHALDYIFTL